VVSGTVRVIDDTTLEVTELPLQSWTQDYKEFLEGLARPEKKEDVPFITDYKEYHTDTCVRFVITLPAENLAAAIASGLEKKFKLAGRISTSNMHAFDGDNHITKYESPEAVLSAFFAPRLDAYARRRELMLQVAGADLLRLENKMRFILDVVNGTLVISKRKRAELEGELKKRGYAALAKTAKAGVPAAADPSALGEAEEEEAAVAEGASYDYLLSMPLWSLTNERVAALQAEHAAKEEEVTRLRGSSPSSLWRTDMDAFLVAYDAAEAEMSSGAALLVKQQGTFQSGKAGTHKSRAAAAFDSDDDAIMEDESDDEDFGAKKKKKAPAAKKGGAGGGGRSMMGPVLVPKPCAAADLYEAAKAKAAVTLAAAWAAPPKAPRVKGEASAFGITSLAGGVGTLDLAGGDAELDDITSPRAAKAAKAAKPRGGAGGVARPKAAPKPKKMKAFSDVEELSDAPDTDDDDLGTFSMSLAQRLAMRGATGGAAALTGTGAAAPAPKPRPGRAAAAKASTAFVDLCSDEDGQSDGDDDDDDAWGGSDASDDEYVKPPKKAALAPAAPPPAAAKKPAAAAKAAPAAARPKAKKVAASDSDVSEADSDDDADFQAAKKPKAKKPAAAAGAGVARKRVAAPKPVPAAADGDTPVPKKARKPAAAPRRPADDDDDDVQIVEAPVVAREAAPRRAAAAARKTYVVEDSEESDGDACDDGDFDGDSD
jgi:DNA topoisomerase-2